MINGDDFTRIQKELRKYFPEVKKIQTEKETPSDNSCYETVYLYLNKSKRMVLKFSRDYLEHHDFEEFCKHLQRNIYYVMKSNINKQIYLLKNFEIEIDEGSYAQ